MSNGPSSGWAPPREVIRRGNLLAVAGYCRAHYERDLDDRWAVVGVGERTAERRWSCSRVALPYTESAAGPPRRTAPAAGTHRGGGPASLHGLDHHDDAVAPLARSAPRLGRLARPLAIEVVDRVLASQGRGRITPRRRCGRWRSMSLLMLGRVDDARRSIANGFVTWLAEQPADEGRSRRWPPWPRARITLKSPAKAMPVRAGMRRSRCTAQRGCPPSTRAARLEPGRSCSHRNRSRGRHRRGLRRFRRARPSGRHPFRPIKRRRCCARLVRRHGPVRRATSS